MNCLMNGDEIFPRMADAGDVLDHADRRVAAVATAFGGQTAARIWGADAMGEPLLAQFGEFDQ